MLVHSLGQPYKTNLIINICLNKKTKSKMRYSSWNRANKPTWSTIKNKQLIAPLACFANIELKWIDQPLDQPLYLIPALVIRVCISIWIRIRSCLPVLLPGFQSPSWVTCCSVFKQRWSDWSGTKLLSCSCLDSGESTGAITSSGSS